MPRGATATPPATRTEGDAASETLNWLRGELDRAWAGGDVPKVRLLALLVDDVQCQAEERRPAASRNLFGGRATCRPRPTPSTAGSAPAGAG